VLRPASPYRRLLRRTVAGCFLPSRHVLNRAQPAIVRQTDEPNRHHQAALTNGHEPTKATPPINHVPSNAANGRPKNIASQPSCSKLIHNLCSALESAKLDGVNATVPQTRPENMFSLEPSNIRSPAERRAPRVRLSLSPFGSPWVAVLLTYAMR